MATPPAPTRTLRLLLAAVALACLALAPLHAQLPAFPGAEGFGSISTGGRGGDVYRVTNLNASGAGSFADAIATAPAEGRTIVFAVSGHIRLPSGSGGGITIAKNKITVAGQTAPGDGICFWNNTMNLTGDDLVFRHIRWRYGKQAAGGDAVDINGSQRIIFDHCDVMFSTDENLSSFGAAPEHLTFQWSTNAWGLQSHSAGGLWKMRHATVHHSLWANNHTRNPKLIGCDVFDWVNNVVFGWNNGFNLAPEVTGGNGYTYRVNIRNSTFSHGGSTSSVIYGGGTNDDGSTKFQLHMSDTALDGNNNGVLDVSKPNYAMVSATGYTQTAAVWPQTTLGNSAASVVGIPVTVTPRLTAYKKILSKTGAVRMEIGSRPLRDEITALCVSRTAALQRGIISDPLELGLSTGTAFAALASAPAPADTDLDGMPDDWESAVGYNPAVADHNTVLSAPELAESFFPAGSPVGYTRLEEYLHFKAVPHGTVPRATVASPAYLDIDLRKFTSGFTASPAFTVASLTGGTVTQSGPGGAIVRFTPTQDTSGRAGFLFTVTDSAGDSWTQQCALLVSTKTLPRPVTWVGEGVTNTWDTTALNFTSALGPVAFAANDAVTINDSGSNSPTLKVTGALAPASVTVSNDSKNFTFQGTGSLAASGRLTKSGTGTLTVSNTGPNAFGSVFLDGGTLSLTTANALGSAPITLAAGSVAFSADQANPLILSGTAALKPSSSRTLNGAWSGSGTLSITNTGSTLLTLGGSMSTFSGDVTFGNSTGSIRLYGSTGSSSAAFDLGTGTVRFYSRNGGSFQLGALSGGSNTSLSGADSATTTSTYTIGALDSSTTFSGRITNGGQGPTALTKTGSGTLTLSGNGTHTGNTTVSEGTLHILGNLTASPVSVSANATLSGQTTLGSSLTAASGSTLSPGVSPGIAGTLAASSLALTSPILRFDLSSNPASGNDRLTTPGTATLTGTQTFAFSLTDGVLSPGVYELISSTGALSVSSVTFVSNLPADSRQSYWFTRNASGSAPGFVRLNVSGTPADLTWSGSSTLWDRETTAAWSGASPATFFNNDAVTFDDSASSGNVTLTQPVAPRSITVNNTAARPYTFTGAPLTGSASLVKSGPGSLTLELPQYTLSNSTLTSGSANVTVSSTANLHPGMSVSGSGIPAGTTILSVPSATTLALSQNATATSSATTLSVETRHTFSGGTFLNGGALLLTSNAAPTANPSAPANPYGLGSGPITFNGGSLTLHGHLGNLSAIFGALPNDLVVPAGQSGSLFDTVRGFNSVPYPSLTGNLTGSGTLNLTVNYYRSAVTGDWSAFAGTLNVARPASGSSDPRLQFGGLTGMPLASVNLAQVRLEYTAVPPPEGLVIPLGSLSGISTSVLSGSQNAPGTVTWEVGALDTSTTYAGSFTPFAGGGPIGLAKTGTGTWSLTGSGNVSGGITVKQGVLSYGDASTDTLSGTSEIVINPAATLQLNSGAKIIGAACEIFPAGTLLGRGTLQAPLNSSGNLSVIGGTLALVGDAFLSGDLAFSAASDRLAVTGNLTLSGTLTLPPAVTLAAGRHLLVTCSGNLSASDLVLANIPAAFNATLDLATPGELAVVLAPRYAYADWQAANFTNPASPDAAPLADPDFDGMVNLLEYVLAGVPSTPDASRLPSTTLDGDEFVFTFTRHANSAPYSSQFIEYSQDLLSWTSLPLSAPASGLTLGPVVSELQTVTLRLPLPPAGRLFGRLRVTLP
jgi:autotransporter-associated beta strand protein